MEPLEKNFDILWGGLVAIIVLLAVFLGIKMILVEEKYEPLHHPSPGVTRFVDEGAMCWVMRQGISCIPLSEVEK